jgi:DNA-binding NtrC family response regulator
VVVIPSEMLRRDVLGQLAALGHEARGTESLEEALALVEARAIDTLVLHVSAFSTSVLARLARAITRRRSIAVIASVSVVSAAGTDRDSAVGRAREGPAPARQSPWQVATYWLPFSRPAEFSAGLKGANLN